MSPSSKTWNDLSFRVLKSTRTIIVGTALAQAIEHYKEVVMPIAKRAIYTVKKRPYMYLNFNGELVPLAMNWTHVVA